MENNTVTQIAALALQGAEIKTVGGIPFALVPEGYTAELLEKYLPAPARKRGDTRVQDQAGFLAVFNRHKTPDSTVIYADRKAAANKEIGFFRAIFNHAREIGYTNAANPASGVKKFPTAKRDTYIEDELYLLVYQAADLIGQRPVDIVGIHTDDIKNGELYIRQQKTKNRLRFTLSGSLKEIIERIAPEDGGYLFRNKRGGQMQRHTLTVRFAELRNRLIAEHPELADELRNFQFRDLRAKSGTDKYLSDDRAAAQEQLGHTSSQTTNIYIRKGKLIAPLEKVGKK